MSQKSPIKIVVVDDHELLRRSLSFSLSVFKDFQLVGEAANGVEAIQLCQDLKPDLVLMDLHMPIMDGIKATAIISERFSEIKILIFTSFGHQDMIAPALDAGAHGCLLKDVSIDEIADAIRAVKIGS